MNLTVKMARSICDEIIAHAFDERPRECCGLLGGNGLQFHTRYPLQNQAPEPEIRYFAAPEEIFEAMRKMRVMGEELVAIYHSHPHSQAYPSPTDIEMAFYPRAIYLIVALEPQTELRAFRIDGSEVIEIAIEILG
jgi:proteasome lid subunit RPN8/RPN11